jgi:MFS family permease
LSKPTKPSRSAGATRATAAAVPPERILTLALLSIVVVACLNYGAMGIVTVSLPHQVTALGGSSLAVGIVAGSLFVSAVVCRPAVGRLAAHVSRKYLVIGGASIDAVCFSLYGHAPNLPTMIALRLVNGIAEAMFYTGSATLVTDLAPATRRAEAISYYSVSVYLGTGVGPSIGVWMANGTNLAGAFELAGGFAAVAAVLATRLPSPPMPPAVAGQKLPWISRRAVVPGTVLAFGTAGVIAFSAYVPLYGDQLGMSTVQWVFLLYSMVIVAVRLLGRIHRLGPKRVAIMATSAIVVGLSVIAAIPHPIGLYLGAAIFASGIAIQFPALMGLALRDAPDHERASVVGTYTAFMDLSQGVSGFIMGVAASLAGYRASFLTGAVIAVCGLSLLLLSPRTERARAPLPAVEPSTGGLA